VYCKVRKKRISNHDTEDCHHLTADNLACGRMWERNLDTALVATRVSENLTMKWTENDRKVVLRSPIQWLAGATNPNGLVLVSSGPIDHFTAKYDSRVTLNPIPCALSTFIITITGTSFTWQSCAESLIDIAEEKVDEEGKR
jgi:hypothetical protein